MIQRVAAAKQVQVVDFIVGSMGQGWTAHAPVERHDEIQLAAFFIAKVEKFPALTDRVLARLSVFQPRAPSDTGAFAIASFDPQADCAATRTWIDLPRLQIGLACRSDSRGGLRRALVAAPRAASPSRQRRVE